MIVPDLRFGFAPLPAPFPGYDPPGDARALAPPGMPSPATKPIAGHRLRGSFGEGSRYVVSIPSAWNGRLVVCGTPAFRSEHANDAILGDFLLERGYAFAASNKGIPYNAFVVQRDELATGVLGPTYPAPFPLGDRPAGSTSFRLGALDPKRIPVAAWQEDLVRLVRETGDLVSDTMGRRAERTYAVGLSIGGAQVRYLIERYPELIDGGLEWASVYWHPDRNLLTYLPPFLRYMPAYVESGYRDADAHAAIVAAGFPPDRVVRETQPRSLWDAHYSMLPPYYCDLTVFAFSHLLEERPPAVDSLEARAAYAPSATVRAAVGAFAHTGRLERPLIGVAGDSDILVPDRHNFEPYVAAVRAAGSAGHYWPYLVRDGTHVDGYAAFGWGLEPQLPFVHAAFERLVGIVERDERPAGAGTIRDAHELGRR